MKLSTTTVYPSHQLLLPCLLYQVGTLSFHSDTLINLVLLLKSVSRLQWTTGRFLLGNQATPLQIGLLITSGLQSANAFHHVTLPSYLM